MKTLILVFLACLILACNDSSTTAGKSMVDSVSTATDIAAKPKKVTGSFLGLMPCNNCSGIDVLLKLTDTSYWKFQNYKDSKDKAHSVSAETGKYSQDSGVIKLMDKNVAKESYKIISQDSLLLITLPGKGHQNKGFHYLVRQSKQNN